MQLLRKEWPDNAVLKQITAVANRVLSFSINSTLSRVSSCLSIILTFKFLTGLELLLAECEKWESVSSKNVSLSGDLILSSTLTLNRIFTSNISTRVALAQDGVGLLEKYSES